MQIRTRLTIQFITIVAGILLFALFFTYVKFKQLAEDEFYNNLRSKALMTAEMMFHDEEKLKPLSPDGGNDNKPESLPFHENITIYNSQLQKVFTFNRAAEPISISTLSSFQTGTGERRFFHGNFHALGLRHTSNSGKEYIIIAESIFNSEDLANLRNILIFSFVLGVALVAAGGWFYAGQAMAPVSRIVDQVDRMLPEDLSARLDAPNNHDEISRLIFTFNRLLDRIQFAFRMQKSFISNVSHELKNPLSVIISQLEIALHKDRSREEYRGTISSVLDDTRELNDVAEKLLQLARVHSEGANIAFEKIRLDETMLQTRATLLKMHPDYHIAFDIEGMPEEEDELCVMANEPLLRSALLNLLDNGCKFSPDKRVEVKVWFHAGGRHRIEIADHGPGIPQKDLQLIFQPFYRSSQSIHIRGSGIGLSLVDSIMKLHRVGLRVNSTQGKGTTFQLDFPAA
ncbi:MAG TPA: HAMP domain-containing sensor histidine kinase [Saprospiraceae bacterium]|nr:HAMP domain-containing sensor histidine kinase [Saprospiraceae bacterium]HNL38062.1 HAMP domain-containing sensor histidine kinase [Saprospiraceae bacterium]HNM25209.1 HAMP domain-containing sensor histidine kinase [Saprospiraceae bacterium]